MNRNLGNGLRALAILLLLAARTGAAPEINQCMAVNTTPLQFELFVRTTEPAGTWVEIFADAAGTSNLTGIVGSEESPVYTGDPAQTTNYYRRADMRAIQAGAQDKGLALHRISGCEPLTTYYCRVNATNGSGSAVWPTNGLLAVTTELENDFVLESRQLLLQLDSGIYAPSSEGAVGVLTATGASGPIASFVGDGVSGNEIYFDLSSLFSAATHINMEQTGITGFDVTLYGPSSQAALTASFDVSFSNLAEVAMADTGLLSNLLILDIRSIAGEVNPPVGLYTNTFGSVISCSVVNTSVVSGTTRQVLAGWSLGGQSGSDAEIEVVMTNNVTLTWNWKTQYWLLTHAGSYGQVDKPDQWVDEGDVVTITAVPDLYYHVDKWDGTLTGTTQTNDSLIVPMTAPRAIFAFFAENVDSNGVSQRWFYENGITNGWETAGGLDHDGDGMITWDEYVAGTAPADSKDVLSVEIDPVSTTDNATLVWASVSNRIYRVWKSTDLTAGFYDISGELSADPPVNTYMDTLQADGQPAYYRISVETP